MKNLRIAVLTHMMQSAFSDGENADIKPLSYDKEIKVYQFCAKLKSPTIYPPRQDKYTKNQNKWRVKNHR